MSIACKDMGVGCNWVGHGDTVDELVEKSKDHAMKYHKEYWEESMSKMSDDDIKKDVEKIVKSD